ncbi:MAG TPA: PQQ-binding-like beta-propeller repeat protein [Mariniphaga sp.]|nr:PQQ-binding-like beta-propeller repeat protein [Mariniphaga sp.]
MFYKLIIPFVITMIFSASYLQIDGQENAENWPQWRGTGNTGAAEKGNPPIVFNENHNLKWKTELPGKGHATPIVWGDRIIIQTAVPIKETTPETDAGISERSHMSPNQTNKVHDFKVLLINRNNGDILWEKTVVSEHPQESTHVLGSWASNSPCTDGDKIYAYFGSRGIFCLDFEGNILWQHDFGQMQKHMSFGEGSSPYLYNDKLFIQWDHEGASCIYALNKHTGEILWQQPRDVGSSWSTPLVIDVEGNLQVITTSTDLIKAYDYYSGETIWTASGMTKNVIPNPVFAEGILYAASGFRGSALQAINIKTAKGDITGTDAILWTYNQDTPYTPQLLHLNNRLYFLRVNNGFLTCLNAKTGEPYYSKQNLKGISTLYSSPTGVHDRIYIAADKTVMVIKEGDEFEVLATNHLDDNFHASPVIVENELILRGFKSLYCFSEQ